MYKEIIVDTFDTIFKNSNNLIQKLLIPIIIISIINYFIPLFISSEIITQIDINHLNLKIMSIPLILILLLVMANISIAITTHRIAILGNSSVPKFGSYIFGLREFNYLFKSILMTVLISIPVIASFFIPIVGPFIAIILILILVSRFSFIFPSLACDEKMSFIEAWKYTKSYKFLSLFTIIIFPIIFAISVGLIYAVVIELLIRLVSSHLSFLYSFLNVFIMVFSISALSSAYLYIKPQPLNKIKRNTKEPLRETIESFRKGVHKIIIHDLNNVTFESLKKELRAQYSKLNFTEIAYDRDNAYLLKNPEDMEAYVSLRYDNDEFTIQVNNSKKPELKILGFNNK